MQMDSKKFQSLIGKTIIILDTNAYLRIYDFPAKGQRTKLNALKEFKNNLWMPNQVYKGVPPTF